MSQPLRKWYFAINDTGFDTAWPLLRVAVASARANTDLAPHCLYTGDSPAHLDRLAATGARVIRHESRLADVLRQGYGEKYDIFSGHWLRVDIPFIEQQDDLVLYTDIDVMFRAPPVLRRVPRYLSAAPERYRWRWPHFNSGVMVLNLPGLRAIDDDFTAAIRARMARGWRPPGHDQVSYNAMFRWRHGRLPHSMNWKPYWGLNPDARIVHFHGPKPENIAGIKAGQGGQMLPVYTALWRRNPEAYAAYCAEWERFLA